MRLNFRKSFKIAPGIRLNLSKSGFGTTIGGKRGRISVSSRGRATVGATAGAGVSVSHRIGSGSSRQAQPGIIKSAIMSFFGFCFLYVVGATLFGVLFN